MVRDISDSVRVADRASVVACLVLDADTGLVVGMSVGETSAEACIEALRSASAGDVSPLEPHLPAQVVCVADLARDVRRYVAAAIPGDRTPPVVEVTLGPEADDIFDSLIAQLLGRQQPAEPPKPEDWLVLFDVVHALSKAEPWRDWPDDTALDLVVSVAGEQTRYATAVIGRQGLQRGIALYPGTDIPDPDNWQPGDPPPVPAGTLLCHLDPMAEAPADQVNRATRYGWPADAPYAPILVAVATEGPADLSARDTQHIALAAAAVLSHMPGREETTGRLTLAGDQEGTFSVQ